MTSMILRKSYLHGDLRRNHFLVNDFGVNEITPEVTSL